MTLKIFLINGPPGSGKDTLAVYLAEMYYGKVIKLADPIKKAVTAIYHDGWRDEFDALDSSVESKAIPQDIYFGKSCRDVQIAVSEFFLKPFHEDKHIFGKLLANRLRGQSGCFFVSDSGFREEAEYLVEQFGAECVSLIRIHRPGCSFKGDSRNYITLADLGVREHDLVNESSLNTFYRNGYEIVKSTVV